mmetsp:Transcript_28135/g.66825  ORF Transcript_28135/g.66825 Transcript_28135/m.66825 type:complete len:422 (+) Transcript_28135:1241-2506(+)
MWVLELMLPALFFCVLHKSSWAEAVAEESNLLRQQLDRAAEGLQGADVSEGAALVESQKGWKRLALEQKARIIELEAQIQELSTQLDRHADNAEDAASDVCEKVASLREHLKVVSSEVDAERARTAEADARAERVLKELSSVSVEVNGLRGKIAVMEENLKSSEEHSAKLSKELAMERCRHEQTRSDLKEATRRLESEHVLMAEQAARIKKLRNKLAKKSSDLASERHKRAMLEASMSTLDSVRGELAEEMLKFREFQERNLRQLEGRQSSAPCSPASHAPTMPDLWLGEPRAKSLWAEFQPGCLGTMSSCTDSTPPLSPASEPTRRAGEIDIATAAAEALERALQEHRQRGRESSADGSLPAAPNPRTKALCSNIVSFVSEGLRKQASLRSAGSSPPEGTSQRSSQGISPRVSFHSSVAG